MAMRKNLALAGLLAATGLFFVAVGCDSKDGSSTPASPAERLQKDTGVPWVVDTSKRTGVPDLLAPAEDDTTVWLKPGVSPEQAARAFIEKYKDVWQIRDVGAELVTRDVDVDEDGMTHVVFDQTNAGVAVFGAGLRVHFGDDGTVGYVNGDFFPNLASLAHSPVRDQAAAIAIAVADAGPGFTQSVPPTATLGFDGYNAGNAPRLVWNVVIAGASGKRPIERQVIVDGQTGAVLSRIGLIFHVAASGTGSNGTARSFEVTANPDKKSWTMQWPATSTVSGVQTNKLGADGTTKVPITSTDLKSWDPLPAGTLGFGAAVDVHANAHLVDQFYRNKEKRFSYDAKASPFVLTVHDSLSDPVNAYWSFTTNDMHYGDGDATTNAITTLDVTGHEITHGFTQYTSKLNYHFQPGALNEAISDIFGELVEHTYKPGAGNLLVGEGIFKSGAAFRDMQHPGLYNQPDHMKNFVVAENHCEDPMPDNSTDCGGVHTNSGIPNNVFALMAEGGINDTSKLSVTAIGWDGARRVWWQSERWTLSAESDFSQAARTQIASAKKVHVSRNNVACAWLATGVVDAAYVAKYKVTCGCADDAGPPVCCDENTGTDAGACCVQCAPEGGAVDASDGGQPQDASDDVFLRDSCEGRPDGIYCSQLADFSSIICQGGSISGGLQCANAGEVCVGPNGPGSDIQCK